MNRPWRSKIHVLLIEDNPADARLLTELLANTPEISFQVTCAGSLEEGLTFATGSPLKESGSRGGASSGRGRENAWDVVLLDLGLPDSRGLKTCSRFVASVSSIPVVVLTGLDDEEAAVEALGEGAQDYLVKGHLGPALLVRSIRYAMERHRLQKDLAEARSRERQAREQAEFARIFRRGGPDGAEASFDQGLDERIPEYLSTLLEYVRSIRLGEDRPSDRLRDLAGRLAGMGVRARDLVGLHVKAINGLAGKALLFEERALASDARLVLLETMGHVLDAYRRPDGEQRNDNGDGRG